MERALDPLSYRNSSQISRQERAGVSDTPSSSSRTSQISTPAYTSRTARAGGEQASTTDRIGYRGQRVSEASGGYTSSQKSAISTSFDGATNSVRASGGQHSLNYSTGSSPSWWFTASYSHSHYYSHSHSPYWCHSPYYYKGCAAPYYSWSYPCNSWSYSYNFSSGRWGLYYNSCPGFYHTSYCYSPCNGYSYYSSPCSSYSYGLSYSFPLGWHNGHQIGINLNYATGRSCYSWRQSCYSYAYSPCNTSRYVYYTCPSRRVYCSYRPYYYDAPCWYGWRYSACHGYYRDVVVLHSTADAYDAGYEDGYYDGAVNSYRRQLSRPVFTTNDATPSTRPFKSEYEEMLDDGAKQFRDGDYDRAVETFKDAVVARPLDAIAKLNLGHAAFAAGRYDLSAFSLRRALILDESLIERAAELNPRGRYADASTYEHQLLRLEEKAKDATGEADLAFLRGYHYFFEGRIKDAITALEETLQLDPNDKAANKLHAAALNKLAK